MQGEQDRLVWGAQCEAVFRLLWTALSRERARRPLVSAGQSAAV